MDAPLDRLRALVLADEALQMELVLCREPDRFAGVAIAAADRHGLSLAPEELAPVFAADPLGLFRPEGASVGIPAWPSRHWLPVDLAPGPDGAIGVGWAHFAGAPLAEPFYTESARRALARPLNALLGCRTPLDDFIADGAARDAPAPDGFIFHMSHCGSTLVAQMLAALAGTIVVSEAPPLDAMVHLAFRAPWPAERRIAALRAMVGALGRRREEGARLIVKLNFWHALALPLFRQAFPATPWLFLHRDPAAVLAAQMRERGTELLPELMPAEIYGIEGGMKLPAEQYCARAIARVCAAALDQADAGGGLILEHARLPDAVCSIVMPHFGMACGAAERAAMAAVPLRHAKRPRDAYRPEALPVGPAVREAVDAHLAPVHRRLGDVAASAKLL